MFAFLLILSFCAFKTGFSQQIIWANKNNLDKRTDFTKVIGQNKFGVYVLKHKNSNFRRYYILEHFDKKMNLLKSKTFRIPNCELEKIVVHSNGILVFTREYIKGNFTRLLFQSIDSSMNESNAKTIFNNNNETEGNTIRIEYNPEKSKFFIWYLKDENEKTKLNFFLYNKIGLIKDGSTTIDKKLSDIFIGDAICDDSGNLYVLYTNSSKFKSKESKDFFHYVLTLNINTLKKNEVLINNTQTFFNTYKLVYNDELATICAFLYSNKL